jgi:tight adherence protein B
MSQPVMPGVVALSGGLAVACALRGARLLRSQRLTMAAVGRAASPTEGGAPSKETSPRSRALPWFGVAVGLGSIAAWAGWILAGLMGAVIGVAAGAGGPLIRRHRRSQSRQEHLERQLGELAESMGLALRSGLSVAQALDFARTETFLPIRKHLDRFVDQLRLGVPFESALEGLGNALGTEDARFFVLVTGIHARTGGDLAGALDEVGRTIRHRVAVRRELRAASAQGRISGAIMGTLPIAFFLFLSVTSHDRLGPVLRSGAGMAMVGTGLVLEGLAYLWIRRLLAIEV